MPKLFISYRRNDSADITGRLHDRLKAHFGDDAIFYDVNSIPLGLNFRKYIEDEVGSCNVLLAVIGDSWLNASDSDQRRLDNPSDLVRIEIETALARDIPVIPVLVGNASMPSEADLPGDLRGLARRNAAFVRSGADFDPHARRLIQGLERLFAEKSELDGRVQRANSLADDDPELALVISCMALELLLREMYERRIGEPPGSRTLEQLSQRLVGQGIFPSSLEVISVVERIDRIHYRSSTKRFTKTESSCLLAEVMAVLKWNMTVEHPNKVGQTASLTSPRSPDVIPSETPVPASRIAIVPKGLRSFDANDADFFLGLLPGPRDKDGLPESIRFWRYRIEVLDEVTFTVGVIYGPSGCGKSSLIKAGLLPHLASHVVTVYLEATADNTEKRLLAALRQRCPGLPKGLNLTRSISALRRGQGLLQKRKVFIVLDQFEQWLHAATGRENRELVQALRQCDGEHVQCVVTVRDDFWLALSRFLRDLEIRLVEGQNSALVDLFDLIHARNVLTAFGQAFGRLQANLTLEQKAFLDQAIKGLAQEGRIISVRLALFAEMVKGKDWTPAIMEEVGGAEGVGVAFLEEAFSSPVASARNRKHQAAVRGLLKALLPEEGSDIKGNMQPYTKLLNASGYSKRPNDFEELLRILDSDVRLITGTDPKSEEDSPSDGAVLERYYQLTHDYLVPSLREWLIRKQKETPEGRAELLLERCTTLWNSRTEGRPLPTLDQWVTIVTATDQAKWTELQRKMMEEADNHHAMLVCDRLLNASTIAAPMILEDMGQYRNRIVAHLQAAFRAAESSQDARKQLLASLALLPEDREQISYLYARLLNAEPNEVSIIRSSLAPFKDELDDRLWTVLMRPDDHNGSQRLRAASALAAYAPTNEKWDDVSNQVANDFVGVPAVYLAIWMELLHPISGKLLDALGRIFRDRQRREIERSLATDILGDYAADQPGVLADLLLDGDENQFTYLFPSVMQLAERGLTPIIEEVDRTLVADAKDEDKERLAKRRANAAVALLRVNQPEKVWPLFKHGPDPRVRSYLIHQLGPMGIDPKAIIKHLDIEPDISIRRALLLSLGGFGEQALSLVDRKALLPKLQEIYRTDEDAGLHASSEWLLRTWSQEAWLKQVNEEWAKSLENKDMWMEKMGQPIGGDQESKPPRWYVNSQGQTMVIVPGPVRFQMGSPSAEAGREEEERQHEKQISRTFALAAKPVTVEQYRQFDKNHKLMDKYTHNGELPVVGICWFNAVNYCNWLSKKEGIDEDQWCFETNLDGEVVRLKKNYLALTGYRLPTESEMEYAIRARALTSRFFGEAEELLPKYAWYNKNSQWLTWPVGSMKPNDLGFFDVHGNVYIWCMDCFGDYPLARGGEPTDDQEDGELLVVNTKSRVLRGGSFINPASYVRSANRNNNLPLNWNDYYGFRLARTFPLGTPSSTMP